MKRIRTTKQDSSAVDDARLSSRAMLFRLRISIWQAKSSDIEATKIAISGRHAKGKAGRFTKQLVDRQAQCFKDVRSAGQSLQAHFYKYTIPWGNKAIRLLPAKGYLKFTQRLRELVSNFDDAVTEMERQYPSLIKEAKKYLGDMYDPGLYPSLSELRTKFGVSYGFLPFPDASDFRLALEEEQIQEIRSTVETEVKEMLSDSVRSLYRRIYKLVSRMVNRLGNEEAFFRNSLIENLKDLTELIPSLNLSDDKELEALNERIKKQLLKYSPDKLRHDTRTRNKVAKKASQIQKRLEGFIGDSDIEGED